MAAGGHERSLVPLEPADESLSTQCYLPHIDCQDSIAETQCYVGEYPAAASIKHFPPVPVWSSTATTASTSPEEKCRSKSWAGDDMQMTQRYLPFLPQGPMLDVPDEDEDEEVSPGPNLGGVVRSSVSSIVPASSASLGAAPKWQAKPRVRAEAPVRVQPKRAAKGTRPQVQAQQLRQPQQQRGDRRAASMQTPTRRNARRRCRGDAQSNVGDSPAENRWVPQFRLRGKQPPCFSPQKTRNVTSKRARMADLSMEQHKLVVGGLAAGDKSEVAANLPMHEHASAGGLAATTSQKEAFLGCREQTEELEGIQLKPISPESKEIDGAWTAGDGAQASGVEDALSDGALQASESAWDPIADAQLGDIAGPTL